jgi:DNA-binding CsgD family transcriptional regulator
MDKDQYNLGLEASELIDLLNAFGDILFITDENFNIKFMNHKGREELDLENCNIIGAKCYKILLDEEEPPDSCPFKNGNQSNERHPEDIPGIYAAEGYILRAYSIYMENGQLLSVIHHMVPVPVHEKKVPAMDDLVISAIDQKIHEELYNFRIRLSSAYPQLTPHNLSHCSLIRMNMSTHEIARYFNVNPTSIQRARVRLKKKMNLSREDDLVQFLYNF